MHLKSLKIFASLTKVTVKGQQSASTTVKPLNLLIVFFRSLFSIKAYFEVKSIQTKKPRPTSFNVSRIKIQQIAVVLDVTKLRGPKGYSLIFCRMNEPNFAQSHENY